MRDVEKVVLARALALVFQYGEAVFVSIGCFDRRHVRYRLSIEKK